jgi:hypothetical protein
VNDVSGFLVVEIPNWPNKNKNPVRYELQPLIEEIKTLLNQSGSLVIEVPDCPEESEEKETN